MPLIATPVIVPSTTGVECNTQGNVTAKITEVDGCSVTSKFQAHEVKMGQAVQLIWQLKTPDGSPIDLSNCIGTSPNPGIPATYDAAGVPVPGLILRMREITGLNTSVDPIFSIPVEALDTNSGLVRSAVLPEALVRAPGIYAEEWALINQDRRMTFSNTCCTFVIPGLFGISDENSSAGPPTLSDIRLSMRDHSGENDLLDNVEFDSAEIAHAIVRPIRYWNETPPRLDPIMTTKNFPFKEMWLMGIQAYLFDIAANSYRRNQLAYSAGGVSIDDKNKEQNYLNASKMLMQQYQNAMRAKKIQINIGEFYGVVGGGVYARGGW